MSMTQDTHNLYHLIKYALHIFRLDRYNQFDFRRRVKLISEDEHYLDNLYKMHNDYLVFPRKKINSENSNDITFNEVLKNRISCRKFTSKNIDVNILNQFLLSTYCRDNPDDQEEVLPKVRPRPYPAAGAIYAVEPYLFIKNVAGLAPGIYHFIQNRCELSLLKEQPDFEDWNQAFCFNKEVRDSFSFVCVNTISFERVTWKYSERGYHFAYLEAGMALQTALLVGASLGLTSLVWGGSYEEDIEELIGVLNYGENVISVACFG